MTEIEVCELAHGDHFRWRDSEWEVDVRTGHIVAYLEGGFGSRVTFYDPLTAVKAGEFSWTTRVERVAAREGTTRRAM